MQPDDFTQETAGEATKRQWQAAEDRMLLYLRCLDRPTPQDLELVLEAVRQAQDNHQPGDHTTPIERSMQILLGLLDRQRTSATRQGPEAPPTGSTSNGSPSTPPLRRLPMISQGAVLFRRR